MSAEPKKQQRQPEPESPQKKPCKKPLAPDLGNGALVQAAPAGVVVPAVSPFVLPHMLPPAVVVTACRVAAPRAPPDPYGLIVSRTTFLLV